MLKVQGTRISGSARTSLAFAGIVLALLVCPVVAAGEPIQWASGNAELQTMNATQLQGAVGDLSASPVRRHVVVRFDHPLDPQQQVDVAAAGITLLKPLGSNAYFATVRAMANQDITAVVPALNAVQSVDRSWKMHPRVAANDIPVWAVVNRPDQTDPVVALYILFHTDVSLTEGVGMAANHGATVIDELESVNGLVLELPPANIPALVDEDAVQWVEWPLPHFDVVNDSNRSLTEANTVQAAPYSLDGSGVTVLVYDGGTARASHNDFGGRLTVYDSSGMDDHPTHVAGTIGGSGASSGGTYKGMAPAVTLLSYGYQWDSSGIFLYNNPGDIEDDYDEAINVRGADIANNSIGTNTASYWDCSITGQYGITSQVIDTIVRGDGSDPDFDEPFRVVWSNGNERQTTRCGAEYFTTAPPSGAKNHITVGALNSNNDSMTSFSSWGPVNDGRIKPDISAPGCQSNGDYGVTSTFSGSDTEYGTYCGTSMAAPTVTGLSALLIEDFQAQFPAEPMFRNSTLKCWLAHSAVDRGNTGPDFQFGYGSVRIQQAIDLMRTGDFLEDTIDQGETMSREVVISGSPSELKVTLAWDDVPGTPNVTRTLINDLDLRVYSPSGVRYYPWTLDPSQPSVAAVRTQEDHVNNIEQVVVDNPANGTWTIEVHGYNVPDGPQPYSLVGDGTGDVGITFTCDSGLPEILTPSTATVIDLEIVGVGQSIVGGSPTFYYRYDSGSFQSSSMTNIGGGVYRATLPAANCSDDPEYYFSAQGSVSGVVYYPAGGSTEPFTAAVGQLVTVFEDNFETNKGWVATYSGASSGYWEREVPVNDDDWDYDPVADSDASGKCYLTDNGSGNTDVDGGSVTLTSPAMDMTGGNITISYDYFLQLTNTSGGVDRLLVEINNNNGSGAWTEIARHDDYYGYSWQHNTITQADLDAASVTLTSVMKLRFTVNDSDPQSIVEGALDAFLATSLQCDAPECVYPSDCDDENPCTDDDCVDNVCKNTNNTASCDDEIFCNGADTCSGGTCSQHAGDPCTGGGECADQCNEAADNCYDPAGTACTDDGNPCTDNQCDGAGTCAANNNTDSCDDNLFCNGTDTCSGGSCSQHTGDPCTGGGECNQTCDEGNDDCFDPFGTACGDGTDNDCTDPDTCDGTGTCRANDEPLGTTCSDGLFCTETDECDGSGTCVGTGDPCSGGGECNQTCNEGTDDCFDSFGTACGDPTDDDCTDPDTCDGAGTCQDNHEPLSTPCDDDLFCTETDECDGSGTCVGTGDPCSGGGECSQTCDEGNDDCFDPFGTACGDPADDDCTNPDTCDGAGTCQANDEPLGTTCDDDLFCTETDECDGGGTCVGSGDPCAAGGECNETCNEDNDDCFDPFGTACGDPTDDDCTAPDTCDGAGTCEPNDEPASTPCDDGLFCTETDECDGGGTCVGSGDPCAAGGECNETCNEDNDDCFDPFGTACGDPTDDDCTDPDTCDGAGNCQDNHEFATTPCDDGLFCTETDECDGEGDCVGFDDPCASGGECNETCNEDTDDCFDPFGTACGDGTADDCTDPDTCDGAGSCQDNHAPPTTPCDDGLFCTETDECDGAGICVGTGDPCAGGSECNQTCNEVTGDCFDPYGTTCGSSADDDCTDPDTCDGAGACQPNDEPASTPCNDGLFCTETDECDGSGTCIGTGDPCAGGGECNQTCNEGTGDCYDPFGTACGNSADDDCTDPDTCNGAGTCQANDEPLGTTCNDGLFCTETDECDGAGTCVGTGDPCAGGEECNQTCNDTTDDCFDPLGTACGDNTDDDCTDPDTCDGAGICEPNDAPAATPCDDSLYCTETDECDGGGACVGTGSPCESTQWCDEDPDQCVDYGTGDFEPDGDIDIDDFADFQACFGLPAIGSCAAANLTGDDAMIDLDDHAEFESRLTGP